MDGFNHRFQTVQNQSWVLGLKKYISGRRSLYGYKSVMTCWWGRLPSAVSGILSICKGITEEFKADPKCPVEQKPALFG